MFAAGRGIGHYAMMTVSGRRRGDLSLWPLGLVLLIGVLLVGGVIFAASFSGGTTNSTPAANVNATLPPLPPTTRDPLVPGECATTTQAVVNYIVGGELQGKLPLGWALATVEYEKPALHALLIKSLADCAPRAVWLRAFTDYADDATAASRILSHACGLEAVRANVLPACR